ncbi:MAG: peptide chain release factor 1 [Patescibacteria group bacterium]|jgi:peptide chain release factor 1
MDKINQKITVLQERYKALEKQLQDPALTKQPQQLKKTAVEYDELKAKLVVFDCYTKNTKTLADTEQLINDNAIDAELLQLAKDEQQRLTIERQNLEQQIKVLLLPPDPLDNKDIIVEIRAGAGGDESALFAAELFRMYSHYADLQGWKTNLISSNRTGIGGFKEVIFEINGQHVYSQLKYESGVHRVQRVPATEKSGRVHTSTVTVAVLPEAEEVDMKINPNDIRIDVFRSGGHGGQSVNTTDSAVRITYLPTGLIVTCQDEKSQHKNKAKAFKVLQSRLLALKIEAEQKKSSAARQSQIGTGDRSEKIRTYNFPQDRITDHRIKQNWSNLPNILAGNINPVINALTIADQQARLEKL